MSSGVPINSARRSKSYAAALVSDVDGIKTSFATSASPVTLVGSDWNGAQITNPGGVLDLPRTITISRSSAANQYSVNDIVLTGRRGSETITENIVQPNDDGNDILRGVKPFDVLTSVFIPANLGVGGSFQIGVQDICAPAGTRFTAVMLHMSDTLNVQYGEPSGAPTDAIPLAGSDMHPVAVSRVLTSSALSSPTDVGLTVYIG